MRRLLLLVLLALLAPASAGARVAIFYYPWYGEPALDGSYQHWQQNAHAPPRDIASGFFPVRGLYSSSSPRVLAAQMREIAAAGVDEVVSSWWGWGSPEDQRLPAVIAAARARGLEAAVHLEPYDDRTVESTANDIAHLRELGIRDFYVYRPTDFPAAEWARLNGQLQGVQLFAQTALPGFAAAGGFAGLYTYDILLYGGGAFRRICTEARLLNLLCSPSVGPGYDASRATGDTRTKSRRHGATYDAMWRAALRAKADFVTITSYNEWNEGTQIEPAMAGPGGYASYDGAWGLTGAAAPFAYLDRTAHWSGIAQFRATRRLG